MAQKNQENKAVMTATVIAIDDKEKLITVSCTGHGRVVIDADDYWYSLGDFDIGTKFDMVCDMLALRYLYRLYPLGSVKGSPAWMENFIKNPEQDAVVKNFWYFDENKRTHIECWSPVWKNIEFTEAGHVPLRYNDVITVKRCNENPYNYRVVKNKTLEEETKAVIDNKLLAGFTEGMRNVVLSRSEEILHSIHR